MFVLGPLAGLAYAMWALWRQSLAPVDLALLVVLSVVTGPRDVARLPPPADAPQLRDDAVAQGGRSSPPARWRCRAGRSTGRRATSSTTPTPIARATRTAPPTASCTPTSAGCSRSAPPSASATARRLLDDRIVMLVDRTALVWLALGLAVPALVDGWRGLLWGGLVRIAAPQPGHVRGELGLPRIRLPAVRDRRREPQQPARGRCWRSARAGTTTTTPSRRWPSTAWAASPT